MEKNIYSGTKTEANLWRAFRGESEARNRYSYFASIAKKEGYEQIASLLLKAADNEKEHGELWFKALGELGDTRENLFSQARSEHCEWTEMYRHMAEDAEREGFSELANQFRGVAAIEKNHEELLHILIRNLEEDRVFQRCGIVVWECRNCGHIEIGGEAPPECPVCHHGRSYFEIKSENY
ncbi:MAG: rubrerythrin family protein [Spirochaetales bacterium]|nr:rubrerythrin family protein [Candidatus Physcosoma equi]